MNSLWDILSVAIGISFIFMILSILNSWIQDYIASVFDLRANNLADIMQNLLEPGAEKLNGKQRALRDPFPVFVDKMSVQQAGPNQGASFVSYNVQTGDTMNKIAAKQKVSVADLQAANPNALDGLWLPADIQLKIRYGVKSNSETLSSIADRFHVDTAALLAANPNALDGLRLPAELKLNTPEPAQILETLSDALTSIAEKLKGPAPALETANTAEPVAVPAEAAQNIMYTVKDQDTLGRIAEELGISTAALQAANPKAFDWLPLPNALTLDILYTPGKGDTLSSIATTSGMSIADLQAENPDVLDRLQLSTGSMNIPQKESGISQLNNRNQREILFKLKENPVKTLYAHPVIFSLSKPKQLPDRLPTSDFTVALLDLLDDAGRRTEKSSRDVISMESIRAGIEELEKLEKEEKDEKEEQNRWLGILPSNTGQIYPRRLAFRLRALLYTAQIKANGKQVNIEDFQKAVSEWYDDTIERGSVWYKRRMQRIGIVCGFLLAIVLNADTIGLSNALWHNAMLREAVLQSAQTSADQGQVASGEQAQKQLETLTNLGLPIGWSFTDDPTDPRTLPFSVDGWIAKLVGLLLTGFAISQGSQLWFDLMNRLLNVRSQALQPASEEPPAKVKK